MQILCLGTYTLTHHPHTKNILRSKMESSKTLGMTSAISLAGPKPSDLLQTKKLEEYLREAKMFETDEEMNHRFEVLGKLNDLVRS
ncbi:poly(A) polymerase type 3-like [Macrobrachium rosenbergii]|uniref:poly(A) polymerase type 3-like n=1 Tax=Macrobrachium rosenbergii TaxID=79674 RepID=UPI0034D690F4